MKMKVCFWVVRVLRFRFRVHVNVVRIHKRPGFGLKVRLGSVSRVPNIDRVLRV